MRRAGRRGRRGSRSRSRGGFCRCRAGRSRTTHVVDVLPERVRLVDAPGELRGVELRVLGWRTEEGETALVCRLVDGSTGTIPARWTDLPRRLRAAPSLGVLATPAGWRLLGERLRGLKARRPCRGAASVENGGGHVRAARAAGGRAGDGGAGDGVGDAAARAPDRGDAQARAADRRARGGGSR